MVIETPTSHTVRYVVETSDGYLIVGHGIPLNSSLDDAYLIKIGSKVRFSGSKTMVVSSIRLMVFKLFQMVS